VIRANQDTHTHTHTHTRVKRTAAHMTPTLYKHTQMNKDQHKTHTDECVRMMKSVLIVMITSNTISISNTAEHTLQKC